MHDFEIHVEIMSTASLLLLLLLNTNNALMDTADKCQDDEDLLKFQNLLFVPENNVLTMESISKAAINHFRL